MYQEQEKKLENDLVSNNKNLSEEDIKARDKALRNGFDGYEKAELVRKKMLERYEKIKKINEQRKNISESFLPNQRR